MKILILNGDLSRAGGTERVSSLLANELSESGYEIVCVDFINGGDPFFNVSTQITMDFVFDRPVRPLFNYIQAVWKISALVKRHQPDVFISVESMLCLFSIPALAKKNVRHLCWEHFNFFNDNGKLGRKVARKLAARFCSDIVTLTERDKEEWQKNLDIKGNILSIPNPCAFPLSSHNLESKNLLAVGGLVEVKGFARLLDAWALVKEKNGFILNIVGDGPLFQKLKEKVHSLGIDSTVVFHGKQTDIASYYREASIFCLSSDFEGFPMVLLEAQAFGLPTVSFDCLTGPAEILDSTGSLLVKNNDIQAFSDAIQKLILSNQLRAEISLAMHEKAKHYQPSLVVQQWLELLS